MIWLDALTAHLNQGKACVLVTVSAVEGSAPRTVGARMLVGNESCSDTIGGGALEQLAIEHSRRLLQTDSSAAIIESHTSILGSDLSQCCGGKVTLSYEFHPAVAFNIVVFGAGHVAQCLATILQQLPCRARFIDSRPQWLKKLPINQPCAGDIRAVELGDNPFLSVEQCPDKAYFLVMTHSHELDFDLVEAILSRGDSTYCGLIASRSKAKRFRTRLTRKGFTEHELNKLTAPIGERFHVGNLPMEVAIAALSEMLQLKKTMAEKDKSSASQLIQTLPFNTD